MDNVENYMSNGDIRIRNSAMEKNPNPCPDCSRTYLISESISVRVDGRANPVWEGCVDCWLKRTSPEMCETFEDKSETTPCPECLAGKCGNCDGSAWSNEEDTRVICPCATQDHPRRTT